MRTDTFVDSNSWGGLYYELCLELGPAGDDVLLSKAVAALWSLPGLVGPWRDLGAYGSQPKPVPPEELLLCQHGVALVDGVELGFVTHVVREEPGSDWLDLCFPRGMLERAYTLNYPLTARTNSWIARVDDFLTQAAVMIFERAPFRLGVIGEETSGMVSAATLVADEYHRYRLVVPTSLADSVGATNRTPLGYGLCVLPQWTAN